MILDNGYKTKQEVKVSYAYISKIYDQNNIYMPVNNGTASLESGLNHTGSRKRAGL